VAEPSKRIGRYEIIERLGRGAGGTRFLARDPLLDRLVAIKLIPFDNDELRDRWTREARAAARLNHPNIETIFEIGEDDGRPFIASEYIRGETLAEIIQLRRPLSVRRKIQIVEDACDGLAYAHRAGFIHRGITPEQIMVGSKGTTKLLGFGGDAAGVGMTGAGMIAARVNYLSPEQITSAPVDARSDVFALGAVFYELVTSQKAFAGDIAGGVLHRIIAGQPASPGSVVPDLPIDLDRIIAHSLEKDPSQRYADAGAMRRELSRVREDLDRQYGRTDSDSPTVISSAPAPSAPSRSIGRESIARLRATRIEQHLAVAHEHFAHGRFEDARVACEQVLILASEDSSALELLDRVHAALDEQEKQRDRARRVQELLESASRLLAHGDYDAAGRHADQLLAIDPADARVQELRRSIQGAVAEQQRARQNREDSEQEAQSARVEHERRRRAEEEGTWRSAREPASRQVPAIVPVFYATDRARVGRTADPVAYGSERSLTGLAYGCSSVSIPAGHRRGHLERPSIFKLEFRETPDRHVVSMNFTEYTKEMFFDLLRKAMSRPDERTTFVFIHGFNVDFNEAVRRTGQLGIDLGLPQAPILYSWPSQGSALQYIADTNAAIWTVPHLAEFLCDLQERSGATSIHLIAHSMGNQALTGALRLLRADARLATNRFKQIVLTAPDLDANIFERDLAPQIVGIGERTTLYASSRDEILTVSKRLNAYRRAGDAAEGIVVVDGVDSIDASEVSTGLGHSVYGDVRTVVEDLSLLLRLGLPPGSRNLITRGVPPKRHWAFPA
jgi:esterase/lipase superfamily enzyme/serine/threonine protein kinase